jgi:subtilisin family serine protease
MLDTAIEQSLPAFAGAQLTQQGLAANALPAPHGTAVAAILVGQPEGSPVPGLVPAAELSIAAVFAADANDRLSADAIALAGGLDWLAKRKVEIVNMSLSGEPNALVELAIRKLSGRGIVFVAAVGNGGASAAPGFPATLPEVIGVTAVDSGGALYKNAPRGDEIDFAAPGVRIWGPSSGSAAGRYFSGTSFAAPFVTAAVALALQDGQRDRASVVQSLGRTAQDLGQAGKDPAFGWGLIAAPSACGPRNRAS